MAQQSLTNLKKIIPKGRNLLIVLIIGLLIIIVVWPFIQTQLLNLAYIWEASKPAEKLYPNPFSNHPNFQSFEQNEDQWKFDSRLPFSTRPGVIYQVRTDPNYIISENQQKNLLEYLGFSEDAQYTQLDEQVIWQEGSLNLKLNLETHALSFMSVFNLDSDLIQEGSVPDENTALESASQFINQRVSVPRGFGGADSEIHYLSFNPQFGIEKTEDKNKASLVMVNYSPKIDDQKVFGKNNFAQVWLAKENKIVAFEVDSWALSSESSAVYLKSAGEIKNAIKKNQGYLDFACRNLEEIKEARLSNPELAMVYNETQSFVQPVYSFDALIKKKDSECTGKLFLPAFKDKYYE